jgi:transposase
VGRVVSTQRRECQQAPSTRLRNGDLWLKTLLVQCAWAAKRKKGSYFNAQFFRLCGRRGPKKAACTVPASLLTTMYHVLKDGTQFQDLGADHFDRRSQDVRAKRLVLSSQILACMPSSLPSPERPEPEMVVILRSKRR